MRLPYLAPVNITVDELRRYREVLSERQLERYGDLLVHGHCSPPFTQLELSFLENKIQWRDNRRRINEAIKALHAGNR